MAGNKIVNISINCTKLRWQWRSIKSIVCIQLHSV